MKKLILKESDLIGLIKSTINSILLEQTQSVDCDDQMAFFYKDGPWDSSNTNILDPSTDNDEMVERLQTIYPENATGPDIIFNGCDDECWDEYFTFYLKHGGNTPQTSICATRIPPVLVCGRPEFDPLLRSEAEKIGWLTTADAQQFVNRKITDANPEFASGLGTEHWGAQWDKFFDIRPAPRFLDDVDCTGPDCDSTCSEIDMYKPKEPAATYDPKRLRDWREAKEWENQMMFVYPDGFKSAQVPVKYRDAVLKKLRLYPLSPAREEYCIKYINSWVKRPTRTYIDDQGVEFQAGPGMKAINAFMFNLACIPETHPYSGVKSIELRDIEHSDFKKGTWVGAQEKVKVKQHTPKDVSYDCTEGGCMQVGGTEGEFKTFQECKNNCTQETPTKTSTEPTYPDSNIL